MSGMVVQFATHTHATERKRAGIRQKLEQGVIPAERPRVTSLNRVLPRPSWCEGSQSSLSPDASNNGAKDNRFRPTKELQKRV